MRNNPPDSLFIKAAAIAVLLVTGTFSATDSLNTTASVYSEGRRSDDTLDAFTDTTVISDSITSTAVSPNDSSADVIPEDTLIATHTHGRSVSPESDTISPLSDSTASVTSAGIAPDSSDSTNRDPTVPTIADSPPPPPGIGLSTDDTDTLATPDTAIVTATEAAQKKVGKTTKILAAAGTSAVVIGVTTYFIVNFLKENNDREDSGIPDPPEPPGYW